MAVHDLSSLPANSKVFVDTNIFFLHFQNKSATVNAFIHRVAMGEIEAYVNIQVLSDLMHKLMLAEAYAKGYITRLRAIELKQWLQANRQQAQTLTQYQQQFENTLAIGVKVLPIGVKLMVDTKDERANFGLMTGDSLHVGTMRRTATALSDIVTYDGDFHHVTGLEIWMPMDLKKSRTGRFLRGIDENPLSPPCPGADDGAGSHRAGSKADSPGGGAVSG